MYAARILSERGHDVTLFEKTDYLGGQLVHAESFSFKWPLKDYRDWPVRSMERFGVNVRLNTRATPELISSEGFDAVFAALGAEAQLPASIEGLRDNAGSALYPTCHDVFGRENALGRRVVLVGGAENTLAADSVVICGGTRARLDEALSFAGAANRFFIIGDCVKPGNIRQCSRDAWSRASLL